VGYITIDPHALWESPHETGFYYAHDCWPEMSSNDQISYRIKNW
jgi:hypothetical protein